MVSPGGPGGEWLVARSKTAQERAVVRNLGRRGLQSDLPLCLEPCPHRRAPRGRSRRPVEIAVESISRVTDP